MVALKGAYFLLTMDGKNLELPWNTIHLKLFYRLDVYQRLILTPLKSLYQHKSFVFKFFYQFTTTTFLSKDQAMVNLIINYNLRGNSRLILGPSLHI